MANNLTLERKEILTCYTWMNPEGVLLSGISQSRKANTAGSRFYEAPIGVRFIATGHRMVGLGDEGSRELAFNSHSFGWRRGQWSETGDGCVTPLRAIACTLKSGHFYVM